MTAGTLKQDWARGLTPNQIRDALFESAPLTTDAAVAIKNLALKLTEARKQSPEEYLRCPRCYGYHSIHGNFDSLCDPCQQTILRHFPEHESIPHIRAALARWKVPAA